MPRWLQHTAVKSTPAWESEGSSSAAAVTTSVRYGLATGFCHQADITSPVSRGSSVDGLWLCTLAAANGVANVALGNGVDH
jgi:hypothetical protein